MTLRALRLLRRLHPDLMGKPLRELMGYRALLDALAYRPRLLVTDLVTDPTKGLKR